MSQDELTLRLPLDPFELAVRMCEAQTGMSRPPGTTAREAFEAMEPFCQHGWARSTTAAIDYFSEQLKASSLVPEEDEGFSRAMQTIKGGTLQ